MTAPATAPPRGFRKVERWLVGLAMAVVALVLERIVMRAVKKGAAKAGAATSPEESTTFTSKGGDVDLPAER